MDNNFLKEQFLKQNSIFEECKVTQDAQQIGDIRNIDLIDNDIWIMQCPKKMDIKQLKSQAIKMPGRTNFDNFEVICMELPEDSRKEAFTYYKNGSYAMRLLPISGNIVVRNRLKANGAITPEEVQKSFNVAKRASIPKNLRTRHPIFGSNLKETELDDSIKSRLKTAEEDSLDVLKQAISNKVKNFNDKKTRKRKRNSVEKFEPIEIKTEKDSEGENVTSIEIKEEEQSICSNLSDADTVTTSKRKGSKRLHGQNEHTNGYTHSNSKQNSNAQIPDNLQWILNI